MKTTVISCTALVALLAVNAASARDSSNLSVLPLSYGTSALNLDGRGLAGTVVLARRDNSNAHGFDVLSLYVKNDSKSDGASFDIVPFFDSSNQKNEEQLQITAGGGADCMLGDFRLVRKPSGDVEIVIAKREYETSYVERNTVTFKYFELKHNATHEVGRSRYYFESVATQQASKKYCDVGEAFKKELGLGSDGQRLGH